MSNLRNFLAASALGAAAALVGSNAALAMDVILDPSAVNGGSPALGSDAAFHVPGNGQQAATNQFTSMVTVALDPAAAGGGFTPYTLTGSFVITQFFGPTGTGLPNTLTGLYNDYNIYSTFSIAGVGKWNTINPGEFDPFTAGGSASLFGSPTGSAGLSFCAAGSGPCPGGSDVPSGVHKGTTDFELGVANLLATSASTKFVDAGAASTTFFNGTFAFNPCNGTLSEPASCSPPTTNVVGNFFQNIAGFTLLIGDTDSTTATGETVGSSTSSSPVTFATGVNPGACQSGLDMPAGCGRGNGNDTFLLQPIPEPASLSILGASLVGMGFAFRRRNRKAS